MTFHADESRPAASDRNIRHPADDVLSVSAGWAAGTPPSRYSAPSTACPYAGTGGAALLAMFMGVGAAIYTKAADVGADLIGKVE